MKSHRAVQKTPDVSSKIGSRATAELNNFCTDRRRTYLTVFVVAVLCYAVSYDGDFVFDDSEAVLNNKDVSGTADFWNFVHNDFWGSPIRSNRSHKSYRPITILTFRLNYQIHGFDTRGYHLVNILLHAVVSAMSVHFFTGILQDSTGDAELSRSVGFLAGLFFAAHPVHSECVANIVGRAELLSALFFLSSFLHYRRNRLEELSGRRESLIRFIPTIVLASLSMLSKEQGITVLGLCAFYELYVLSFPVLSKAVADRREEMEDAQNNNVRKTDQLGIKAVRIPIHRVMLLCCGCTGLTMTRIAVMGFHTPQFSQLDNPASFHPSLIIRVINYIHLYSLNAWLLISPSELCFDYSMGCIPLITHIADPRILISVLFLVAGGISFFFATSRYSTSQRVLTLSLVMVLLPFFPASNVLFRVGFVLAERVLYLPSLGYCLALAFLLYRLSEQSSRSFESRLTLSGQSIKAGTIMLLLIWGVKCHRRSSQWRTESELFASGAVVCPMNAKVHYNMGKVLSDSGMEQEAEKKYRTALKLHTKYDQAMNNLANLLKDRGNFREAEKLLLSAIAIRPDFSAAWMNLGIVQTGLRKYNEAEIAYFRALRFRSFYPDCYFNLGNLYLEQGRLSEAFNAWNNATGQRPSHSKAWINKMIMFDSQDDCQRSVSIGIEALTHLPGHPGIHFSLGSCLGKLGRLKEAESHILKAIQTEPGNPNYYGNLGVLYHRWNRSSEAEAMYYQALHLDPRLSQVRENLDMLRMSQRS